VPTAAARRVRIAQALLWITPLLWSSNYVVARLCHGVIAPHVLALGRWTLALAIMLPFAWRGLLRDGAPWRREWRQLLVLGGLGMWVCGAFVYIGGETTSAINIGLFYAATPVLIAVISARLLGERMTGGQTAGLALALLGVVFVIAKGHIDNLLGVRLSRGDAWIVAAALGWAAYSVLLRVWPSVLGPAERLVVITAGGVIVLLPFTALELLLVDVPGFSLKALGLVVLAALLPGVLSYQAYSYMQRELGAMRAALVLYLGPLYSAFTAWLVLGEPPAWYHAAGAVLILPSIYLATSAAPTTGRKV
jgi:drug/metabolite transporter (DMT)-like permease